MPPHFRFQTLLNYRNQRVEDHQVALARAQNRLKEVQRALHQLQIDRQRLSDRLKDAMGQGALQVDNIQYQYRYLETMDQMIQRQQTAVDQAYSTREEARADLEEALKERKTLEKLKEYGQAAFQEAVRQHEAEMLDDLNIARFNRNQ